MMADVAADMDFAGALLRLTFAVQARYREVGREFDLTSQQAVMLCALLEQPYGMTDLAARLRSERSALTGLVDRAQLRGLVIRTPDPRDRRAMQIELTPEGRELAGNFMEAVTKALTEPTARLPARMRQSLQSALPDAAAAYWEDWDGSVRPWPENGYD